MSLKGNYLFLKITQGSDKKTQPFGGLEPQLASIKSPNKKAWVECESQVVFPSLWIKAYPGLS